MTLLATDASTSPYRRSLVKTSRSTVSAIRKAATEATARTGDAMIAAIMPPINTAAIAQRIPSASCKRSRRTKERPASSTPDGARVPGQTGMRHGPSGTQTVPKCAMSQFAAGTQLIKAARFTQPAARFTPPGARIQRHRHRQSHHEMTTYRPSCHR